MSETLRLGLPLLAPSQAQKHVTVNEALLRLDALVQIVLASRSVSVPPASPAEGAIYAVPAGATGAWAGQAGRIAVFLSGGWDFVAPVVGWRGWIADEGAGAVFVGSGWQVGVLSLSPYGAGATWRVAEIDHVLTAGASNTTALVISPDKAMVFGVTARVVTAITGSATGWQLGTAGAANRFGDDLGKSAGSFSQGVLGAPMTYFGAAPVILTAKGGSFAAGGRVRLAAHYLELSVPSL